MFELRHRFLLARSSEAARGAARLARVAVVLGAIAIGACTKTESQTADSGPAIPSAAPTTAEAASAAASAATIADAAVAAEVGLVDAAAASAETDAGKAAATVAAKDASAPNPAGSSSSGANADCGTKPQPDCPLQAWMKANANTPLTTNDTAALALVYDKIVGFAPPAGYANWASISKDGAKAARAGDMAAAKAACRSCHDQYKAKYKTEMRARKI